MGSLLDEYLLYRTILADNIETLLRGADTTAVSNLRNGTAECHLLDVATIEQILVSAGDLDGSADIHLFEAFLGTDIQRHEGKYE